MLTNSLPKLSIIAFSPPETAGYQVGRIYGRTCQLSKPFHFLGYARYSHDDWKREQHAQTDVPRHDALRFYRPAIVPAVDAICQGIISGVLVRLTTCKRLTDSLLPKLSLTYQV